MSFLHGHVRKRESIGGGLEAKTLWTALESIDSMPPHNHAQE